MYHPARMSFALHPTLARDTVEVARFPLCRVLLMKDRRFPWLILVPEREGRGRSTSWRRRTGRRRRTS